MNSPPYHYYHHYHHDPTLINAHTLLNPQTCQQPAHNNTYSATAQYWNSRTPSFHQQQTHTTISSAEIGPLLNQILQSQENFKHTLSLFANEVSLFANEISQLNTTLAPSTPNNTQHFTLATEPPSFNINHSKTQQQSYTPLHQQPIPSPNHTQHASEPIPFNTKPIIIIESVDASKSKEATVSSEILNPYTVNSEIQENIFTLLEIGEGFNELSTLKEEKKHVPYVITISAPVFDSVLEEKRDVSFSATTTCAVKVKHQQQPHLTFELPVVPIHIFDPGGTLTVAVNPSVERCRQIQRYRSVVTPLRSDSPLPKPPDIVWERRRKREAPQLTSTTMKFCIYVFDPGEGESQCRSPMVISVQSSRFPTMFSFPARGSSLGAASGWPWVPWSRKHKAPRRCFVVFDPGGDKSRFRFPALMSDTGFSFLCAPWDRGKKSCNYWNIFLHFRRRYPLFHGLGINFAKGLLTQFGLPTSRFGPKETRWVRSFNG